jgi:hypothetical protein
MYIGPHVGAKGQGLGILGGGYGSAQVALSGANWFPGGWFGVELLLLLGVVKIVATSLTVGSGGSAGDFGPSLVIGGLLGGAFGRAAQLLLHDPRIDPGAFALVGMGIFYGGLAHVPIASLVMVCELAGSYDLLVPLMLAEGIAFVALRNRSLYHAQVPTKRESPAHRDDFLSTVLKSVHVSDHAAARARADRSHGFFGVRFRRADGQKKGPDAWGFDINCGAVGLTSDLSEVHSAHVRPDHLNQLLGRARLVTVRVRVDDVRADVPLDNFSRQAANGPTASG